MQKLMIIIFFFFIIISNISDLYARIIFLPDYIEQLEAPIPINPCIDYNLFACPIKGECVSCANDNRRYKLISCESGYIKNGNFCLKKTCGNFGSNYADKVSYGQVCEEVQLEGITCYHNCRDINCVGYTLECETMPEHALNLEKCKDCQNTSSQCGKYVCKISKCEDGYKIASNGTECLPLDDTCPEGYYKECETGIETTIEPVITEAGNECYQCRPKIQQCPIGQWNLDTYWCNGALRCWLPQI